MSIKIPKYENWLKAEGKVSLKVGIVKEHISKPKSVSTRNIFAIDTKLLVYRE